MYLRDKTMPYCKNCGARITKFEKDICPVCGQKHPLEGASSDTVEITTELNLHDKESREMYKAHFRSVTFALFSLIGFSGAGFFYLRFKKLGFIWLGANIVLAACFILLFGLSISYSSWITYVATIAILYLVNIGSGLYFLIKKDIKDGNGEFVR